MKRYDAVVIGGGFAGVAAALAAKREGAQVLIIEKGNWKAKKICMNIKRKLLNSLKK